MACHLHLTAPFVTSFPTQQLFCDIHYTQYCVCSTVVDCYQLIKPRLNQAAK